MSMRDLLIAPTRLTARSCDEPPFRQLGVQLMNQQYWCWGCDIRRPLGNLLLAFGFERRRPPADVSGSSCYRVTLQSGRVVCLWGFGVLIEDRTAALHLGRFTFEPHLCAALGDSRACWTPAGLAPLRRPAWQHEWELASSLCSELLSFIGEYESWVAEAVGLRYRQETVDRFEQSTHSAAEAKLLWPRLARQCARHYRRRAGLAVP